MAIFGKVLARGMLFAILAVAGAEAGSLGSQPIRRLPEPPRFPFGEPVEMTLLATSQGWVLTDDNYLLWTTTGGSAARPSEMDHGALLSTSDGGATWSTITPGAGPLPGDRPHSPIRS